MMRRLGFWLLALTASPAFAGDYIEGYFHVVRSIPSEIRVEDMGDVAAPVFRETVQALATEWSAVCGVPVDVWHTNLMGNPDNPWTADYWFAYLSITNTQAEAHSIAPATGCLSESYVKFGSMVIPTPYQICAGGPDFYPDIYDDLCE